MEPGVRSGLKLPLLLRGNQQLIKVKIPYYIDLYRYRLTIFAGRFEIPFGNCLDRFLV